MRNLLEPILRALIDNQEKFNLIEIAGDDTLVFEVEAAKEDLGKLIGKGGKTVESLRTILNAIATKQKKRIILTIKD